MAFATRHRNRSARGGNADTDALNAWRAAELAKRAERNTAYMQRKEAAAASGDQAPEVIAPGSLEHMAQMSWDFSQGWRDRAFTRIKQMRQRGHLKPAQIVDHGTHIERVYESEVELEVLRDGDACARCGDFQPEDNADRERLHERLNRVTGFELPFGLTIRDCCCYCGNRLDTQRQVA